MSNRRNAIYVMIILSLVGYIASGGRDFMLRLAYLFGALLIFCLLAAWSSVQGIMIGRQTKTQRAYVGRTLDELFTVRNTGLLPKLWLEVRDHSDFPGHNASTVVPTLMPNSDHQWVSRTVCVLRGEWTLGPVTLVSGDPFGLYQITRHLPATSRVLVYPAVYPLYDFPPSSGALPGGESKRRRTHFATTNIISLRKYSPGDSLKRMHWKASARRDELMVKEYEIDPLAQIWLAVDLNNSAHFARPYTVEGVREAFVPPTSLEYAIVIAASIASDLLMRDQPMGFVAYHPTPTVLEPGRGMTYLSQIMEILARTKGAEAYPFAQVLALEGRTITRGSTLIAVTADPSQDWIAEVAQLTARDIFVVAVLLDPASFGAEHAAKVEDTRALLTAMGAATYVIRQGESITNALASGAVMLQR
jgi:uncharacterized protein (DUF58 family)